MATTTTWGNYRDYQGPANQNPGSAPSIHVRDVRLTLLDSLLPGLFNAKNCLDIGCNAGRVSCQLALDFGAASVTGVDIDTKLVDQASNLLALRSSRVRPANAPATAHTNANVNANDNASGDCSDSVVNYFPMSAILNHGYRFEPQGKGTRHSTASAPTSGPETNHRVRFVSEDWVVSSNPATDGPYHVILALSVIKWMHLEHGDEGLVKFFRKCAASLANGGFLIIELQDWQSYQKAVRSQKGPHYRESLEKLQYRPETSFTELLREQGFTSCATSEELPRRISVYCLKK
ncbi:S-adenosyl-L-methionine-dependent methyltransferase [Aaosphaeria arxii CBS 175.79]|uniref:RNA methyltransferase n=1 Tax=Aaosphaeria arxii CBS 175.79 TaxID=1450172 RepID=A0A6A5X734_9PLEO|nr:S-adenosyl-L-methionine-dependent methyltransferase [Aaosphaeria arxii CBS 175.79]KAF2008594.1 S-adenosyl-L-methionine-dependent methyltransferase [Aaosphaeria arxii CBS 175.79]